MIVLVKKTTELTESEKFQLLSCFIEVFEHDRSMEEMYNQYTNTPMGYCVHSMCFDEDHLVAAHTAFPSYYWLGEKLVKTYITGDTMVKNGYRDGFVFLDVVRNLTKTMKNDGYAFSFGFPNDKSYPVFKKAKLGKDIGRLDTFILPYRIGGIKEGLNWLNPLSKLFCSFWLLASGICLNKKLYKSLIHKDDETYNPSRYKRLSGNYCHVNQPDTEFYYKIKMHEGVRTAFLIDVIGKSEFRFHRAVKYIMQNESDNFDLIMYVGYLPSFICKTGLIKIPRKYEPKHFYMTGGLLDKSLIDDSVFYDVNNWDVNLSDYDLI